MKVYTYIFISILMLSSLHQKASCQNRLILENSAYLIIDDARVIIDNSSTNALSTVGKIISEGEDDIVQWNIRTGTGTYTIPFASSGGTDIPMVVDISTGGTESGTGMLTIATYAGSDWENSGYMPTGVLNVDDNTGTDNSAYVVDRFWLIDCINYSSNPRASLSFEYLDSEHSAAGNTITESDLGAQYYNSDSDEWYDYIPAGTANTTNNIVSGVDVDPSNFYKVWTLVDKSSPLPIELISFTAECNDNSTVINWETATELNNDYYIIKKSTNGLDFKTIDRIPAVGNSNILQKYSTIDYEINNNVVYYKLLQVDIDGSINDKETIAFICKDEENDVFISYENNYISVNNASVSSKINIYNSLGQLIAEYDCQDSENTIRVMRYNLSKGVYYLHYSDEFNQKTFKIFN